VRVERLADHHQLSSFTCGVKALDDWLRDHALDDQRRNPSRTFVLLDDGDRFVGSYALTMGGVRREAPPAVDVAVIPYLVVHVIPHRAP
jgi:hypothetical protein